MNSRLLTVLAGVGSLLLATSIIASDVHREHKIKLKLDGHGAELIEADVSDMAVGESRTWVTESGRTIDLLRSAEGMEVYIDGELVDTGYDGAHGGGVVLHEDIDVACFSDSEGDCEKHAIFVDAQGDADELHGYEVRVLTQTVELVCDDEDTECERTVWIGEDGGVHEEALHQHQGEKHRIIKIQKSE